MLASSPFECKNLGKKIQGYDENVWKEHAEGIALKGTFEKFRQNTNITHKALVDKDIYEASVDTLWGIGVHIKSHNVLNRNTWSGDGIMHRVYARVREQLKSLATEAT